MHIAIPNSTSILAILISSKHTPQVWSFNLVFWIYLGGSNLVQSARDPYPPGPDRARVWHGSTGNPGKGSKGPDMVFWENTRDNLVCFKPGLPELDRLPKPVIAIPVIPVPVIPEPFTRDTRTLKPVRPICRPWPVLPVPMPALCPPRVWPGPDRPAHFQYTIICQ